MQKKLPPKSRLVKENQNLRIRLLELEVKLEKLNHAWEKKFSLLAGIFEAELAAAATIGELRRWYADWQAELDAIDPDDPEADAKMQEIFDRYELSLVVNTSADEMVAQES